MRYKRLGFLLAAAGVLLFFANAMGQDSFAEFRRGILGGFQSYRDSLREEYDKFLDGAWSNYVSFRGENRTPIPKPRHVPRADTVRVSHPLPPQDIPVVDVPDNAGENVEIEPATKSTPDDWAPNLDQTVSFDFYCFRPCVPEIGLESDKELFSLDSPGAVWRRFKECDVVGKIVPGLRYLAETHCLSDWFYVELVRAYVDQVFVNAGSVIRVLLTQYLLLNSGFDVRLGVEEDGTPMLLIAIEQLVFARSFAEIGGTRYYIFHDSYDMEEKSNASARFRSCDIPDGLNMGRPVDMVIHKQMDIPVRPHKYEIGFGGIAIRGEVNENLVKMLYKYPQVPIACYEQSVIDFDLRDDVVMQLKRQLSEITIEATAVDKLLHFVQESFDYATDDEQHGFEKPYFFEEILYYPQCDCEDRSIFYSYLLWHVLGVENLLIGFPGHEAVAVHLPVSIKGDGYLYDGKPFYISDPTYMGAPTGMCMDAFRDVTPTIDYHWH